MNKKFYTHLNFEERETLSLGLAQGQSLRIMSTVLGRTPSTLSRECARNATGGFSYRACTAHTLAVTRTRLARRPRKLLDPWLWRYVQTHLVQGHSPEQIAGRLRREYPTICRNTSRPRPSTRGCMYSPVAVCGVPSWPRCGRRAKHAALGLEGRIDAARSPT